MQNDFSRGNMERFTPYKLYGMGVSTAWVDLEKDIITKKQ
jgi:hypothetical protein